LPRENGGGPTRNNLHDPSPLGDLPEAVLPLVLLRGRRALPVDEATDPRKGDHLVSVVLSKQEKDTVATMAALGWQPVPEELKVGDKA